MFVMVLENVLQNLIGVGERKMFNVFQWIVSYMYINACSFPHRIFFFLPFLFPSPFLWGLTQGMWQKRKYQMEVYSLLNTIRQYNQ